ncbi:unnamed protein product [Effrenium voratum]|uniref:inosine/xanthosine triphosphatase n=1 Tax=Effrenium voratum TaxID=2562239 RepID=A0AA36N6W7_9DINO|nr:unnamed protein product [Effrenium voratum]CAJ1429657.1 unnamed protein product [Effrenium voratum]
MADDDASHGSLQVIVASTAKMKVAAVMRLFAEGGVACQPDRELVIEGVKAKSGVNDQPFGHEETIRGALNRLAHAQQERPGADFYLAMENGLFDIATGGTALVFDLAWVVIEDKSGRRALAHSAGVQMPNWAVDSSRGSSFSTTAGGEVARAATTAGQEVDPQDPHAFLTSGLCKREDLLTSALAVAWGQLKFEMESA